MDGPDIGAEGEGARTRNSASRFCRRSFSILSSKKVLSLEDEEVSKEREQLLLREPYMATLRLG